MLSNWNRTTMALITAIAINLGAATAHADTGWPAPEPNAYVQTPDGQSAAAMYPSPRPVPPYVGMTYITYEAFSPNQYMYPHAASYVHDNGAGGVTRTNIMWAHHPTLFFLHPNLRAAVPALHTPATSGFAR